MEVDWISLPVKVFSNSYLQEIRDSRNKTILKCEMTSGDYYYRKNIVILINWIAEKMNAELKGIPSPDTQVEVKPSESPASTPTTPAKKKLGRPKKK